MSLIDTFTKFFLQSLKELVDATSDVARPKLHPILREPGLAIGYSDPTGKSILELLSKNHAKNKKISINGILQPFSPEDSERYAQITSTDKILVERQLFPYIPDGPLKPAFKIGRPNISLMNFCFSTPEYKNKYWKNIKLVSFSGDFNVPFEVTQNGRLMGFNLLHGLEVDGKLYEKYIEFALVSGKQDMIALDKTGIREIVFTAFSCLVTGKQIKPELDFSVFLKTLEKPVKQNVLLLGSYNSKKDEDDFRKLKSCLATFGYHGFMLKDSQDVSIQSNIEKLLAAIICSCFVIVLDSQPSGHIAEISELLSKRFRPVIIIRHKGARPSTYFLEDKITLDDNFRIAEISDVSNIELLPHIEWAKGKVAKQIEQLNTINSWRN